MSIAQFQAVKKVWADSAIAAPPTSMHADDIISHIKNIVDAGIADVRKMYPRVNAVLSASVAVSQSIAGRADRSGLLQFRPSLLEHVLEANAWAQMSAVSHQKRVEWLGALHASIDHPKIDYIRREFNRLLLAQHSVVVENQRYAEALQDVLSTVDERLRQFAREPRKTEDIISDVADRYPVVGEYLAR